MRVFKKLNAAGIAHVIVPIIAVVGVGVIGTYMLVASHANSTQVTCSYNGHTYSGSREYNCGWSLPTPVVVGSQYVGSNHKVGTFYLSSTNWVLCQQKSGVEYHRGAYYNNWWAYSKSDQGAWGWVNATYGHGGINNGSFGGGVPNCNGKHGTVPTLAYGSNECVLYSSYPNIQYGGGYYNTVDSNNNCARYSMTNSSYYVKLGRCIGNIRTMYVVTPTSPRQDDYGWRTCDY